MVQSLAEDVLEIVLILVQVVDDIRKQSIEDLESCINVLAIL